MSQQINLFNPIFLKQKKHFSAATMAQGLAVVLLGSIAVAGYAHLQLKAMEDQAAAAAEQLKATKAQLAKVSADYAPRQKNMQLEAELQRMEGEVRSQRQAFDIVQRGGVGNTNGYSEYLRAFSRQIVDGLWLTGFSIDGTGSDIALQGRALQPELVPAYISRLKQEQVMRGKSFSQLVMATPEVDAPENKQDKPAGGVPQKIPARYVEFALKSFTAASDKDSSIGIPASSASPLREVPLPEAGLAGALAQ